MTLLRFLVALPFRLIMMVGGLFSVLLCAVSIAFLIVSIGAQIVVETTLPGDSQ